MHHEHDLILCRGRVCARAYAHGPNGHGHRHVYERVDVYENVNAYGL